MFQELGDLSVDFQKVTTKKQLFLEKYIKCHVVYRKNLKTYKGKLRVSAQSPNRNT